MTDYKYMTTIDDQQAEIEHVRNALKSKQLRKVDPQCPLAIG